MKTKEAVLKKLKELQELKQQLMDKVYWDKEDIVSKAVIEEKINLLCWVLMEE